MVDALHNRFTSRMSPMNPESQHPQDGNPMELMTNAQTGVIAP